MAKSKALPEPPLAALWSPPAGLAIGDPGRPVCCIATTYTFHARLLEADLLPRFLGLKRDATERERAFIVEREEALSLVRTAVLVDTRHVDRGQSSLRWDQIPVVVPGGAQHSKVTLLVRENAIRLVVASANLTTTGYRRNREMAVVMDFFDHAESAPRDLLGEALAFLREVLEWTAAGPARRRVEEALDEVGPRSRPWKGMPETSAQNRLPKVGFAMGWPDRPGRRLRSPLETFLGIWGNERRMDELTVMTPSIGEDGESMRVVRMVLQLRRRKNLVPNLVVPGRADAKDPEKVVVALPASFRAAWADELGVQPEEVLTYVPPARKQEEKRERELHAKALLVSDQERGLLMAGSSNFSSHGMGVGVANLEANVCVLESISAGSDGPGHASCLPVDWETDHAESAVWPEEATPIEEESGEGAPWVPAYFAWATFDQRKAILKVGLDGERPAPDGWSIRLPGDRGSALTLVDAASASSEGDGFLRLSLGDAMKGVLLVAIRIDWRAEGKDLSAYLPVQAESPELLASPGAHLALSAARIVDSLISGQDVADAEVDDDVELAAGRVTGELESLRAVETEGYLLYRTRRLGRALAALGERIEKTLRTIDAMRYRLLTDPFGPVQLAEALGRETGPTPTVAPADQGVRDSSTSADLAFSLAEIALVIGHAGKRVAVARGSGEPDLRPVFREAVRSVLSAANHSLGSEKVGNLRSYVGSVKEQCGKLLGGLEVTDAR